MTRIAGLPQTSSQRAFDMLLKVTHVQRMNAGGGVVFATGTPIANSVAEMFTMQRYLQMTALKALQIDHFDSWAATFGEPVTAMELAPDGSGYASRSCEAGSLRIFADCLKPPQAAVHKIQHASNPLPANRQPFTLCHSALHSFPAD
jgi:hypothetical protein